MALQYDLYAMEEVNVPSCCLSWLEFHSPYQSRSSVIVGFFVQSSRSGLVKIIFVILESGWELTADALTQRNRQGPHNSIGNVVGSARTLQAGAEGERIVSGRRVI